VQLPLDYPLLAALYSDIDCRTSGHVWYRVSSDPALLNLASDWVVESAGFDPAFSPRELFIATWDRVGYFEEKSDKVRN
jgi:nidogen (entactin)